MGSIGVGGFVRYGRPLTITGETSSYEEKETVGKSCDQVGIKASQDGELVSNDGDVFDKISQAINSSFDLVRSAHYAGDQDVNVLTAVIPLLVIPANRLWTVWYDNSGEVVEGPSMVSSVSYFVGKRWTVSGSPELKVSYRISHLEIADIDDIESLVRLQTTSERISEENIQKMFLQQGRRPKKRI